MLKKLTKFLFKTLLFIFKSPFLILKYILKALWFILRSDAAKNSVPGKLSSTNSNNHRANSPENLLIQVQSKSGQWQTIKSFDTKIGSYDIQLNMALDNAAKSIENNGAYSGRVRAIGEKSKRPYEIR